MRGGRGQQHTLAWKEKGNQDREMRCMITHAEGGLSAGSQGPPRRLWPQASWARPIPHTDCSESLMAGVPHPPHLGPKPSTLWVPRCRTHLNVFQREAPAMGPRSWASAGL